MENVIMYEGKHYRKVKRRANVGDKVKGCDGFIGIVHWTDNSGLSIENGMYPHNSYVVLEPVEEPTPQLAGIHDSLASLAIEVTKLKSVINGLTGQLTPLQLAILNAENTPADVKLSLIVEAGRLEEQRKITLKEAE